MAAPAKRSPKKTAPRKRTRKAVKKGAAQDSWLRWTVAVILAAATLRLAVNALGLVPVHFDEGQYWAYGQEMAAGHFSKPPLVGWVIWLATELGGDTTFALRVFSVISHGVVAAFIFLSGRRLFDGRTGFWAATAYTVAPGVSVSAMIMSTDPVMMAFWGLALYAWIRAAEGQRSWWAVMGAAIGAGMLAKYTMLAFVAGTVGYGLFSARGRDFQGMAIAAGVALFVFSPNLVWQLTHDFATARHVAEDAA
ncbi:MAG: glycosyltransferase family 39 protein, partial [Pseudomonadota bacterium]